MSAKRAASQGKSFEGGISSMGELGLADWERSNTSIHPSRFLVNPLKEIDYPLQRAIHYAGAIAELQSLIRPQTRAKRLGAWRRNAILIPCH